MVGKKKLVEKDLVDFATREGKLWEIRKRGRRRENQFPWPDI